MLIPICVFGDCLQGLYVCDANGTVLCQQELDHSVILDCLEIADSKGRKHQQYARLIDTNDWT